MTWVAHRIETSKLASRRLKREIERRGTLGEFALEADAQIFKPLDQFRNGPTAGLSPGEASHDGLPQVDAKGLDFNAFFQGLAGIL